MHLYCPNIFRVIKKNEMCRADSTYGGKETCIQGFGGETWGEKTTWKTQTKMGG
jgi:hypothetical protein